MRRTILAGGVFDFYHQGHKDLIDKCRHIIGDGQVVIMVNSDEFVKSYKGVAPAQDEITRVNQVRSHPEVNTAFILPCHNDQKRILDEWRPTMVAHGTDWTGEGLYVQFGITKEWLDERNILFVYVDRTPGISSSQLRAMI